MLEQLGPKDTSLSSQIGHNCSRCGATLRRSLFAAQRGHFECVLMLCTVVLFRGVEIESPGLEYPSLGQASTHCKHCKAPRKLDVRLTMVGGADIFEWLKWSLQNHAKPFSNVLTGQKVPQTSPLPNMPALKWWLLVCAFLTACQSQNVQSWT